MKKHVPYLAFFSLLFIALYSSAQPGNWSYIGPNRYYLGGNNDYFGDITFVDAQHGYATDGTNPRIMTTVDGGATWQMNKAPISAHIVQFLNTQTGWLTDGSNIARTTDGGTTWTNQLVVPYNYYTGYIWSMQFIDASNGFLAGTHCLSKTTDGGLTWSSISPWSIDSNWNSVFFLDANTGWAFGDSTIAKTTDGGQTWTSGHLPDFTYERYVSGARFYSSQVGVVITRGGTVLRTDDGGNTWTNIHNTGADFGDVYTAKFGAAGFIYQYIDININHLNNYSVQFSTDTGRTWTSGGTTPDYSLGAIYFQDKTTGFLGSMSIYKTTDGGTNWSSDIQQYPSGAYSVLDYGLESPAHHVAITEAGGMESFDAGANWQVTQNYGEPPFSNIQNVNSNCYFTSSYSNSYRYQNGTVDYTFPDGTIFLYAQSPDSFIASYNDYSNYYILRTINGGQSYDTLFKQSARYAFYGGEWTDANNIPNGYSYTFARFMDWNNGIIAYFEEDSSWQPTGVSNEKVTTDGGAHWTYLRDSSSSISNTKVSPSGELYAIRNSNYFYYGLYKWVAPGNWQIVGPVLSEGDPISQGPPDFGWSKDGILWASNTPDVGSGNFSYSFDNGNSWNLYPLRLNGNITMFKQLLNGEFIAGTGEGELLQYNGDLYNCRIKGNVFYDFNSNGIFDSYDKQANAYPVNVMPGGLITFTGADGNYITSVDSGTYSVFPDSTNRFKPVPVARPVSFTNQNGVSADNNFALQPVDPNLADLSIHTFEEAFASAPGFQHTTYLHYTNLGVQPVQPVVTMVLDTALTFVSASPLPTSQTGNVLTWNLATINPFDHGRISVTGLLSDSAQLGQQVMNVINIAPLTGDANPVNNTDSSVFYVLGSFDPNYKITTPTNIAANQSRTQSELEYTISFQNTGTASTHFVIVKDQLNAALDPATLQVIGSSAPCDHYFESGNVLVFRFSTLQLPDSASDPEGSHGYVSFTISPKAKSVNTDTIFNSADIYFDYNAPVTTQAAKTAIDGYTTAIEPVYGDIKMSIYPNPSTSIVHVESDHDFQCVMYDMIGRPVMSAKSAGGKWIFDVSKLSSGMYLLRVEENGKEQGFKISVLRN